MSLRWDRESEAKSLRWGVRLRVFRTLGLVFRFCSKRRSFRLGKVKNPQPVINQFDYAGSQFSSWTARFSNSLSFKSFSVFAHNRPIEGRFPVEPVKPASLVPFLKPCLYQTKAVKNLLHQTKKRKKKKKV